MEKEAPHASMRKELTSVMLVLLMMGAIAASVTIVPPLLPINDTVTVVSHGHYDYSRSIAAGKTVTIQINVLEGTPPATGETILLYIMDPYNYNLKMNSSPAYAALLVVGAISRTSTTWRVPADGKYYFVVENPTTSNATVAIKITWELEWLPAIQVGLSLSCVAIAFATIQYAEHASRFTPRIVELRGDLDMIPDVVASAPHGLRYIVIAEPTEKRCAVCNAHLEEGKPVSRCPHCGSASHSDHFLDWVRTKGRCPACGKQVDERDIQPKGQM